MSVLNQFSFVFLSGGLGAILGLMLWTWRRPRIPVPIRITVLVIYAAVMLIWNFSSHYQSDANSDSVKAVEATLQNGQPSFVMLYSNY